jgi:hypothetical protein
LFALSSMPIVVSYNIKAFGDNEGMKLVCCRKERSERQVFRTRGGMELGIIGE